MIYINYEQLDNKIGRACHEEYALTYEQIKGYMKTSDKVDVIESRWIENAHVTEHSEFEYFTCANCEMEVIRGARRFINGCMVPFNYCPNCGAKMRFVEVGRNGD